LGVSAERFTRLPEGKKRTGVTLAQTEQRYERKITFPPKRIRGLELAETHLATGEQ